MSEPKTLAECRERGDDLAAWFSAIQGWMGLSDPEMVTHLLGMLMARASHLLKEDKPEMMVEFRSELDRMQDFLKRFVQ